MKKLIGSLGVVTACVFATACGGGGDGGGAVDPPAAQMVGAAGGTVATSGGAVEIEIPAGALAADVEITITGAADAALPTGATIGSAVGTPYTFGPEGQVFASPVTVRMEVNTSQLGTATLANVVVFSAPVGTANYERLPTTPDGTTGVLATTTHFSTFVPVIVTGPVPDAASGTDGGATPDGPTPPDAARPDANPAAPDAATSPRPDANPAAPDAVRIDSATSLPDANPATPDAAT